MFVQMYVLCLSRDWFCGLDLRKSLNMRRDVHLLMMEFDCMG